MPSPFRPATDLLTHALAVAVVVGLNAAMGGRLLSKGLNTGADRAS